VASDSGSGERGAVAQSADACAGIRRRSAPRGTLLVAQRRPGSCTPDAASASGNDQESARACGALLDDQWRAAPPLPGGATPAQRDAWTSLSLRLTAQSRAACVPLWTWSKVVRKIALRADVPRFSTHALRHLCLTDLARAGWELHAIATFAGHYVGDRRQGAVDNRCHEAFSWSRASSPSKIR
jgi:hypothetical protein